MRNKPPQIDLPHLPDGANCNRCEWSRLPEWWPERLPERCLSDCLRGPAPL